MIGLIKPALGLWKKRVQPWNQKRVDASLGDVKLKEAQIYTKPDSDGAAAAAASAPLAKLISTSVTAALMQKVQQRFYSDMSCFLHHLFFTHFNSR